MNKENKALIFLIPGFPSSESDTTCLPYQQIFIRRMKELYPAIRIIVLSFQYPYHQQPYTWHNVEVIPFGGKNRKGIAKLWLRKRISRILDKIRQRQTIAGLISFWYGECGWIGHNYGKKYGIRHYCWIFGQDAKKENRYPARSPFRATELIALSDFLQTEFEKNHGIRPVHVIPTAIDARQLPSTSIKKDIDIIGVGSLIPLKQYEQFVNLIAAIKVEMPGIKAVLIGKGPEENKLRKAIHELNLDENLKLTGEISYPDVMNYMRRARIFLHPSSYEGFSGVCLEALANGCELISYCWAMSQPIPKWHLVKDASEMKEKTITLLKSPSWDYQPVIIYRVEDTVKSMMDLFGTRDEEKKGLPDFL